MKNATYLLLILAFAFYTPLAAQGIDFEVRNEQITGGTHYEFDVYMIADQSGTFHSRGQIYISYNPLAFGNQVWANGKVSFTELALLNEDLTFSPGTKKYATINAVDNGNNLVLTWQGSFLNVPPSALFHTEVPITYAPLYHVSIELLNPVPPANLALNRSLMFNPSQQFFLVSAGNESPYNEGNLPVELLDFTAEKANDKDVMINWVTATELNNDFFVIEKKRDNGEFEVLGQVTGAGTTQEINNYEFLDQTNMGTKNAYRLRQVDFDGSYTFSDVVEIYFDDDENIFTVYPSPAKDFTMVKAKGKLDGDYRISISDMSGRVVGTSLLSENAANGEVKIDLSGYSEGIYTIKMVSPLSKTYVNRVMKLK